MELTILMPCLNEVRTLQSCIEKAKAFLLRHNVHGEILIADNGSTDGSIELAQCLGARVVPIAERGYGAALMGGILAAKGRYVVMGDSDDSYDFSGLLPFLRELRAGADLVVGNRFRGGISPGAMPFLHRYLGNPVLSYLGRLFFEIPVGDFHCGLRGFSKDAIVKLSLHSSGMEFATEMIAKAARSGLRITEVPTTLHPDGRDRAPHLRTWRDGWRHLLFMLLYSPRWLFLIPGLILTASGGAGMAFLVQGPHLLFGIGLGVHSLLYTSAAVIIGMQLMQFSVLLQSVASASGLLANVSRARRMPGYGTRVETGLLIGFAMVVAGLWWSAVMTGAWTHDGFPALDPERQMRHAIPAVTLMILGLQVMFGSFLSGALHLIWKSKK